MRQAFVVRGISRTTLRTFTLGLGASALAMACSFGEIDGADEEIVDVAAPADELDAPETDDPNDAVTPPDARLVDDVVTPPADDADASDDSDEVTEDFSDTEGLGFDTPLGEQVAGILQNNCSQCHANGVSSGEVDYILNLQDLVENDKIIPGDKDNSPLYVRMEQGSMPPAFIRDQRPTRGDVELVGQFISELGDGTPSCEPIEFLTYDEMFQMMMTDVLRQDVEDRPFIRYFNVSYSSNAGQCGIDLQRQRYALAKMVNSVSINPRVTPPVSIDSLDRVYRIDIRDYDWDRGIDIDFDGVDDFDDAWDAILDAVGAYAVEFEGDEADVLNAETQTTVPMLPVNAFVQEATRNELYYALTDAGNNLFDFEAKIGVNAQESADEGTLMRAGVTTSGVSKQDRVITRQDNGISGNLAYWLSFDFGDVGNDSIYANPLDFAFAGGEAIYNLPNGMQAYLVAAAAGTLLNAAPNDVVQDPAQNNGIVQNGASCHSCHNAGLIPFSDQVKPYVLSRRTDFDAQTFEDVQEQYPDAAVFDAQAQADSRVFINATERAGVPEGTPDPLSRVFLQFQLGDVTTALAAGELGVTPEDLMADANRLDPRFDFSIAEGRTDRNTFTNAFVDSICIMQSFSQNRPANCN